tara:strand:- start:13089 stop:14717 length:1629 start_codon:yes stop_codon:yes gene_type:complete
MADTKPEQGSAGALYKTLEQDRMPFLLRAIEASNLTIPTLVPPLGHDRATKYYTPYQSIGARGVNNLASKLLLALLPPNTPCFRLDIDSSTLEKLGVMPEQKADVESKLAKMERSVQRKIETEAIRVSTFEALKHIVVGGNGLLYLPQKGGMRVFHLHNFVIQRDPMGQVLDIVVKERVAKAVLSDEVRQMLGDKGEGSEDKDSADKKEDMKGRETNIDMFTHVSWDDKKWEVYQEVQGMKIPSSIGEYPADKSPWIPIRMAKIDGESYGRGYVEEYLGDLKSLEGLSQAIIEGAAAAAKILFLVNPNGTTSMDDLATTESGGFCQGTADDVNVLQLQKYNDFRVALDASRSIEERLSFAFMLNSSVQRAGERVTAEEIRFMAQELESGLGGVYSILSQEFQLPLINRLMFRMQRAKELPTLPKGVVEPVIVTGIEALGRGNDLNKLDTFMEAVMQIPEATSRVNWADYMTRRATALGIDTEGLIKTDEQVQQEQQQAQMMQMAQQGLGPAIGAAGQMAKQGMVNDGNTEQAQAGPAGPPAG